MLRFFAAFIVVIFHLNLFVPHVNNWYTYLAKYGWLGVPIFFVISGYCIMISAYNSAGSFSFLVKRFFRIYPTYWLSIIIVGIAAVFQKFYTGTNSVDIIPHSFTQAIGVAMLFVWPLTPVKTPNFVCWTLICEIMFYLIISVSLLFSNNYLRLLLIIFISLTAALIPIQKEGILFIFDQWPAFGLGISVFYSFYKKNKTNLLGAVLLFLINLYSVIHKSLQLNQLIYAITAIIICVIIGTSHYIKSSKNIFSVLGEYSYAVYLIHVPVGILILGYFKTTYINNQVSLSILYDLVVYSFISTVAWQIFVWIEKPSIRLGKKLSGYKKRLTTNI